MVLSRTLAEQGHFPAIDIEASVSRTMYDIVSDEQLRTIQVLQRLYSVYQQNSDLINVGVYVAGNNETLDKAIEMLPAMNGFLRQDVNEAVSMERSISELAALFTVTGVQTGPASQPMWCTADDD